MNKDKVETHSPLLTASTISSRGIEEDETEELVNETVNGDTTIIHSHCHFETVLETEEAPEDISGEYYAGGKIGSRHHASEISGNTIGVQPRATMKTTSSTPRNSTSEVMPTVQDAIIYDEDTYEDIEHNGPPLDSPPFSEPHIDEGEFQTIYVLDEEDSERREGVTEADKKEVKALFSKSAYLKKKLAYVKTEKESVKIGHKGTSDVYYVLVWNEFQGCYIRPSNCTFVYVKKFKSGDRLAKKEISVMQHLYPCGGNEEEEGIDCCLPRRVLHCIDALAIGGQLFVITPYYDDLVLETMMTRQENDYSNSRGGGWSNKENIGKCFLEQIVEGIQYMHDMGVCHRSLSLPNIKIVNSCFIVLVDLDDTLRIPCNETSPQFTTPRRLIKGEAWHKIEWDPFLYKFPPKMSDLTPNIMMNMPSSLMSVPPEVYYSFTSKKRKRVGGGNEFETMSKGVDGVAANVWNAGVCLNAYFSSVKTSLSENAKDIMGWMGQEDPKNRPSIKQIMTHQWMQKDEKGVLPASCDTKVDIDENPLRESADTAMMMNNMRLNCQNDNITLQQTAPDFQSASSEKVGTNTIKSHEITENDIICVRGGGGNNHPGNKYYRAVCKKARDTYIFTKKGGKREVAGAKVLEQIRKERPNARFLKKMKGSDDWVELNDKEKENKIMQRIREGTVARRKAFGSVPEGTGVKSRAGRRRK